MNIGRIRPMWFLPLLTFVLLLCPTAAFTPPAAAGVSEELGLDVSEKEGLPELVNLNVKDLELSQVIELLVKDRDLNIIYPPGLNNRVTVRLKDVHWQEALRAVLRMHGYGFTTSGTIIMVDAVDKLAPDMTTRNYRLRYFSFGAIEAVLKGVVGETGAIQFVPRPPTAEGDEMGTLLITTSPEGHEMVTRVLGIYDIPAARRRPIVEGPFNDSTVNVRFVETPVELAIKMLGEKFGLNVVWETKIDGRVTLNLNRIGIRQALDSILVPLEYRYHHNGSNVRIVKKEGFAAPNFSRVFDLEYLTAAEARTALDHKVKDVGTAQIVGDEAASRRLMITAPEETLTELASIISNIDVPKQQILINLFFVEVSLTEGNTLGIDWSVQMSLQGGTRQTAFPFNNSRTITGNPAFNFGLINAQNLGGAFDALKRSSKVRILNEPSLTVRDDEEATILVGQSYPITVETLDRQTLQRTITLDRYQDIGIELKVLPRVCENNIIDLKIEPKVSEVGELVENRFPVINTREAETRIQVHNGEAAVIGGLIRNRTEKSKRAVPLLSKIPGLGKLFQTNSSTDTRTELLIFVVPKILSHVGTPLRSLEPVKIVEPSTAQKVKKLMPKRMGRPRRREKTTKPAQKRVQKVAKERPMMLTTEDEVTPELEPIFSKPVVKKAPKVKPTPRKKTPAESMYARIESTMSAASPEIADYVAKVKERTKPYDFVAVSELYSLFKKAPRHKFETAVSRAKRFDLYDPSIVGKMLSTM